MPSHASQRFFESSKKASSPGSSKSPSVSGARVGGKTGTSDPDCCAEGSGTFASFVGIMPIDAPRWVIYVGIGNPKTPGTGGSLAAPAFSRIATRALSL